MNLQQELANDLFWFVVLAAFAVVVYLFSEFVKTRHAASAEIAQVLEQGPPARDGKCGIENCTRLRHVTFTTPSGVLHVCAHHLAKVGEWVGLGNAVYDQDLDPVTDLSQWNKEMDAS